MKTNENGVDKSVWITGIAGIAVYALAIAVAGPDYLKLTLYIFAWLLFGHEVLLSAIKSIASGDPFNEFFLMSTATIGAFFIGEYSEAVAVMLFYRIGDILSSIALNRSRASILSLMELRPDTALLMVDGEVRRVSPEKVEVGDRILVMPGGRVPVDGLVLEGDSEIDVSALTGESIPAYVSAGAEIMSGAICLNGTLVLSALRSYSDSAVARILQLVEKASARKSKAERFATRFAKVYTPIVTGSAVLLAVLPPLLIPGEQFSVWIYRALVFLVVSCPCALVVSIPLGFFAGLGYAAKRGILIKGGQYLEALNHIDTVVFDKTGTLTEGKFSVVSIFAAGSRLASTVEESRHEGLNIGHNVLAHTEEKNNWTPEQAGVLKVAAEAEMHSTHPIAVSILGICEKKSVAKMPEFIREHRGKGIEVIADNRHIFCGSRALLEANGISIPELYLMNRPDSDPNFSEKSSLTVHVAEDGKYLGNISLEDSPRAEAKESIQALRGLGIQHLAMVTGDTAEAAGGVAAGLGLKEVHSGLLPGQKVEQIESMLSLGRRPVFVGDGINDAPVLVRADVGIAMGGIGSDAAMEACDIVLMRDDLALIPEAIRIARRTRSIVMQNIVLALSVKALVLLLGAGGLATLWEAVIADVGVTLIAVLNATRILKTKKIAKR